MFDALHLSGPERDWRPVVGAASLLYLVALVVLLLAGPVVLVRVTGTAVGTALRRVALVVAVGYVLGMALLLR